MRWEHEHREALLGYRASTQRAGSSMMSQRAMLDLEVAWQRSHQTPRVAVTLGSDTY